MTNTLQIIIEQFPEEEFTIANGFNGAVIGVDEHSMRLVYSIEKCIEILVNEMGMESEEAMEFFDFNIAGSYVGDKTPIWCYP
jgi:hypothetical protein